MFKNPRVLRNIAVGTGALVTATAIKQIAFFVNRLIFFTNYKLIDHPNYLMHKMKPKLSN